MRRQLATTTVFYSMIPFLEKGLHLLLTPIYTHFILPKEFGAWALAMAILSLLNIVAPLRLDAAFSFALRKKDGWKNSPGSIIGSSFKGAVLMGSGMYLALFPIALFFHMELEHYILFWSLCFAEGWIKFVTNIILRKLQMVESRRNYFYTSLLKALLFPALSCYLVAVQGMGVIGIALADFVSTFLIFIFLARFVKEEWRLPLSTSALKEALHFSLPLLLHSISAWGLTLLDRVMLERMTGLSQVGIYDVGARLTSAVLYVASSANQAYSPFFFKHLDTDPGKVGKAEIGLGMGFICMGLLWALMLPYVFKYAVDSSYSGALGVSLILILDNVLNGFYFLAVNYLMYLRQTKVIAISTGSSVFLNFVLNFWWIPLYGSEGAAWASVMSRGSAFLFAAYFSQRVMASRKVA